MLIAANVGAGSLIGLTVGRLSRLDVSVTGSGAGGHTYLIVGSDSRVGSTEASGLGDERSVPGTRADVILLVRADGHGTRVMGVPRDLLVDRGDGALTRLTLTRLQGPQAVVDAICRSLGIGVDRVIEFSFEGFKDLVNAVGGIDVPFDQPIKDDYTGLDVEVPGVVHLDGDGALGYVRSRHPQILDSHGEWVPATVDVDLRSRQARRVLELVAHQVTTDRSPSDVFGEVEAAIGGVSIDRSATVADLVQSMLDLRSSSSATTVELPVAYAGLELPTAQLDVLNAGYALDQFHGATNIGDTSSSPDGSCAPHLLDP